jgi:hypothetical protein
VRDHDVPAFHHYQIDFAGFAAECLALNGEGKGAGLGTRLIDARSPPS